MSPQPHIIVVGAGISGMILSVPAATVIVEMLEDLAKQREEERHNGSAPQAQNNL